MKPWLLKKQEFSHVHLIRELQDIPEDWKNYLRMNKENYLALLERITPLIKKQNNVMRLAITPHERLAATLRFLITGGSLEDLKFSTRCSYKTHQEIFCRHILSIDLFIFFFFCYNKIACSVYYNKTKKKKNK